MQFLDKISRIHHEEHEGHEEKQQNRKIKESHDHDGQLSSLLRRLRVLRGQEKVLDAALGCAVNSASPR